MSAEPGKKNSWTERVSFYQTAITGIVIPPDIDPMNIIRIESELDNAYSKARLDLARIKVSLNKIKNKAEAQKKDAMVYLADVEKDPNLAKDQKPTNDKQREAWIHTYLSNNNLSGMNITAAEAIEVYTERHEFMSAIVDILRTKHDRLITDLTCLKLDVELSSSKVPNGAEKLGVAQQYIEPPSTEYPYGIK